MHFIIADNGHGVPPEFGDRLFQPFFTTKEGRGNGLGLALSKRIIERHGGTIGMKSSIRPGKSDTLLRVTLPA